MTVPDSTVQARSVGVIDDDAPPVPVEPTETEPRRRVRVLAGSPAIIAIITWLLATPLAFVIPRVLDLDPISEQGAFIPLAAGGVLLVGMTALAWWRRAGEWVPAVAAGLFAAWVALVFRVILNGTPYGPTGLIGDQARMSAAATRYTANFWSTDQFIEGLPSEYPPLFPWLVGRSSLILGVPAWRLLPFAQVALLSFAVLVAFLMWRRLVPAGLALPLSGIGLLAEGDPRKAFALVTLFAFIPWLISAFTNPPRGRMHWLPAGVIGGLIMLTYIGWFPFGMFGVLAILVASWRRSADRAGYVRNVLLVGVVAVVIASPYLVPYLSAVLTKPGQAVADLYVVGDITANGFPFIQSTLLGVVELFGLAGLVWYRKQTWWAWPLLYLVIGSYLFWLLMGIRFVANGHTTLLHYVPRLTGVTLLVSAVLAASVAGPGLARRLRVTPPYRTGAAVTAVLMLWLGFTYYQSFRPYATQDVSRANTFSTWAHLEPRPDCSYPKYAPADGRFGCYPIDRIRAEVEKVRGVGDRPHTLASDERLFAYLPWPAYMGMDRTSASTLARWDDRHAELSRLSEITDPAEFARATASSEFGPIDVLVMHRGDDQNWFVSDRAFHPEQFDSSVWQVVNLAPQNVMIAVRRPA